MFLTRFFNTYNNTRVFQSKVNSSVRKRIYILRSNIYIYICIYIVKYKGVLKIIFGIYTRCQQIDVSQSKVNSSAEIYTIEDPTGTSFFFVPVGS